MVVTGTIAIVAASACGFVAFVATGHLATPAFTGELTVVTYNIHAGRSTEDSTVAAIRDSSADVICLQEVTPSAFDFIRRALRRDYPASLYRNHHDGYGGLAFFSKYRLDDKTWIAPRDPAWFPAWIVEADTAAGRVQLMNIHLRPRIAGDGIGGKVVGHFKSGRMHQLEIESLYGSIVSNIPTIILGDFNEFDGDPAIQFLADRGYSNALTPFGLSTTWEGKVLGVTIRSCVDHILHSPHFECATARVISGGGSDHQPVVATLRRKHEVTTAPGYTATGSHH